MSCTAGDGLCWFGYALLAASIGGPFWPYAYLGAPAAFAIGFCLQRSASQSGDLLVYDHAVWISRIFFLKLILYLLGLLGLFGIFYAIGSDDGLMAGLESLEQSLNAGTLSDEERVTTLLRTTAFQLLFGGIFLWWLLLAWPLKRLLHGLLALRVQLAPRALPRIQRFAAFAAALVLQLILLVLFMS